MGTEKTRLTLELTPWLEHRLKAAAHIRGMSISQYCVEAIDNELTRDEAEGFPRRGFKPGTIDRMVALRKEIFEGKKLPGDSVELLREARAIREKDMDRWAGGEERPEQQ